MEKRPNIILIMTDQQRYDTIGALGFDYMETPHLDRLVKEGVSFDRCYVTGPTCVPSRASFFHGLYPHTTGIYKNLDAWSHSWVQDLAASGYHCVNIGKMHTIPAETPLGFHERFVVENKDRYLEGRYYLDRWDMALQAKGLTKPQREIYRTRDDYGTALGAFDWPIGEDMHPDAFVGNTAAWWIRHKPKCEDPLFLQIGFPGPHPPYDAPEGYAAPYLNKELPRAKSLLEENPSPLLKSINRHNCEVDHDSIQWSDNPTDEQIHNLRAHYYGNMSLIDEKIGEILDALEEKGYLEDSLIIFTSDHGDCLGDHGQIQKWSSYEEVVRVPMIVWSPSRDRVQGGRRIEDLCQHFDMVPVILDAAGVDIPEWFETRSLTAALTDDRTAYGREFVFCEQGEDDRLRAGQCSQMTMIRSRDWKMVHYLNCPGGELYDIVNDPEEKWNLWDAPEHDGMRRQLTEKILEWHLESRIRTKTWPEEIR